LSSSFIGANTIGFGGIGSGFTGGFGGFSGSGPKLSSFASGKPDIIGSERPAKAFGAPESDADELIEGGESESGSGTSDDEEKSSLVDDKKKRASKSMHRFSILFNITFRFPND
jgi:hypothetical protein